MCHRNAILNNTILKKEFSTVRLPKLLAPSIWITLPSQAYGLSERVKKQWRAHALLAPVIFTFAFTAVVSLPLNAQTVGVESQNQKDHRLG